MSVQADPTATIYRSTTKELTDPMRGFLSTQPFLTLATTNPDGSIHLVPTWFLFEEDLLYIATWSGSRKARNVAARSRVTVTVDDRGTAEWASAVGTAELVVGESSSLINDRLRRRYMTEEGIETLGPLLERAEDATIAIRPQRWKAWDYQSTLMAAVQNAGIPLDGMDGWYLP